MLVGDVGGGFGMKTGLYPEDIAGRLRARASSGGRCKWCAERSEEFLAASHGRDIDEHAPSSRSTPTARSSRCACGSLANVGAYATTRRWRSSC